MTTVSVSAFDVSWRLLAYWCEDNNIEYSMKISDSPDYLGFNGFCFKNEEDAIMFKLKFGV